ncbi:MAG: transcription elongation factor GreA [Armatimonadetes bacterium]|nr:transcription elongation factor GreA [Armatimonadota bacterium]
MQAQREVILTVQDLKKIEEELDELRKVGRKRVAERIRDSKQFGELTENSEFEDAKNEQAQVEGRIDELRQILAAAQVVELEDISTDEVGVGSIVGIRDVNSRNQWEWTIVGTFEADPAQDRISNESPVGEALIGKKIGDIVSIDIPAGKVKYEIVSIRAT